MLVSQVVCLFLRYYACFLGSMFCFSGIMLVSVVVFVFLRYYTCFLGSMFCFSGSMLVSQVFQYACFSGSMLVSKVVWLLSLGTGCWLLWISTSAS